MFGPSDLSLYLSFSLHFMYGDKGQMDLVKTLPLKTLLWTDGAD